MLMLHTQRQKWQTKVLQHRWNWHWFWIFAGWANHIDTSEAPPQTNMGIYLQILDVCNVEFVPCSSACNCSHIPHFVLTNPGTNLRDWRLPIVFYPPVLHLYCLWCEWSKPANIQRSNSHFRSSPSCCPAKTISRKKQRLCSKRSPKNATTVSYASYLFPTVPDAIAHRKSWKSQPTKRWKHHLTSSQRKT